MATDGCILVVGGTAGIGKELARYYAGTGRETILTGRDPDRAAAVATEIGGAARGIGLDLARPKTIYDALSSVGAVRYLAIVAIQRDDNTIRDFDIDRAMELATLKLVGFAEVVHVLLDRLAARQFDRAVRRSGEGPAVSGLDDGIDGQRRRSRVSPGRSRGSSRRSG